MKKFGCIFLTFLAIVTSFLLLFCYAVPSFVGSKTTKKMVDSVITDEVIDELKESSDIKAIYEQVQTKGIDEKYVDALLDDDELSDYANDFLQEILKSKMNGEDSVDKESLNAITKEYIESVVTKNDLDFSESEIEDLAEVVDTLSNDANSILDNDLTGGDTDTFFEVLKFCKNGKVRAGLLVLLFLELVGIVFLSFKKRSFLSYFSFIAFTLGLNVLIISGLVKFIIDSSSEASAVEIINPIITQGLILGGIFILIAIILYIGHVILRHNFKTKEEVPF